MNHITDWWTGPRWPDFHISYITEGSGYKVGRHFSLSSLRCTNYNNGLRDMRPPFYRLSDLELWTFDFKISLLVIPGVGYFSSKFEHCMLFRFRVNGAWSRDRQTGGQPDGAERVMWPPRGGPRNNAAINYVTLLLGCGRLGDRYKGLVFADLEIRRQRWWRKAITKRRVDSEFHLSSTKPEYC